LGFLFLFFAFSVEVMISMEALAQWEFLKNDLLSFSLERHGESKPTRFGHDVGAMDQ
jgi:hypothetical protein